jgi:hypothetical protein
LSAFVGRCLRIGAVGPLVCQKVTFVGFVRSGAKKAFDLILPSFSVAGSYSAPDNQFIWLIYDVLDLDKG